MEKWKSHMRSYRFVKKNERAQLGIEPRTSHTRSENHTTRPLGRWIESAQSNHFASMEMCSACAVRSAHSDNDVKTRRHRHTHTNKCIYVRYWWQRSKLTILWQLCQWQKKKKKHSFMPIHSFNYLFIFVRFIFIGDCSSNSINSTEYTCANRHLHIQ